MKKVLCILLFLCFIFASCINSSSRATNYTTTTDNTVADSTVESTPLTIPSYEPLGEKTTIRFPTTLFSNNIECLKYTKLEDFIQDFEFLRNNTSITALDLSLGDSFSDLSPLGELSHLEALEMVNNKNVSDLTPLMKLTNLKMFSFYCYTSDSVTDIGPLASLTEMRYLFLNLKNIHTDCVELINMHQLEGLHFSIGNIISVNNISGLRNLKELSLDVSHINDDSISALANLSNLQDLELFGVRYTDGVDESNIKPLNLEWITSLTKLEGIRLEGFDIEDISPLAELPNLKGIDVNRSRVHNYYPLVNSKSLVSIGTPVLLGSDSDLFEYQYKSVFEILPIQTLNELRELFGENNISFRPTYDR